jgi:hypothetical protein
MPSLSTLKLIGYGVGVLAVIALLAMVNGWRVERNHLRDWQSSVVTATRQASNNPKLSVKDVPQQIHFMEQAIGTLTQALNKQSAAVNAMGQESARQQQKAAQASQVAQGRAREAESVSARLTASSRSTVPPAASTGPCEPSKALKEQWR